MMMAAINDSEIIVLLSYFDVVLMGSVLNKLPFGGHESFLFLSLSPLEGNLLTLQAIGGH